MVPRTTPRLPRHDSTTTAWALARCRGFVAPPPVTITSSSIARDGILVQRLTTRQSSSRYVIR